MKKFSSALHHRTLWLLFVATISISLTGCSAEKRLQKAKIGLDSGMQATRGWPYNYTFQNYCNQYDKAESMLATCKHKENEATKAKNESAAKVMSMNVKHYEADIERLTADKSFYKVYKLHVRVNNSNMASDAKTVKTLEKQKQKDEKAAAKKMQAISNKNTQDEKARDASLKQQRKALDAKKK